MGFSLLAVQIKVYVQILQKNKIKNFILHNSK